MPSRLDAELHGLLQRSPASGLVAETPLPGLDEAAGYSVAERPSGAVTEFATIIECWQRDPRCFESMYTTFAIAKRDGGSRRIDAPFGLLKALQQALLATALSAPPLHDAAHGFRVDHSTSTNARPHVGQAVVLNLDIRDFFQSIGRDRVRDALRRLGLRVDDRLHRFLVDALTYRGRLPQGAPTSPALANLVARSLDARLVGLAVTVGATYTRYADDLTFSGGAEVAGLVPAIVRIVEAEGFSVADEKTRIQRRGGRQDVTGLTVNERLSVPRVVRRRLRSAAHHAARGLQPHWQGAGLTPESLRGHMAYLAGLHADEAKRLLQMIPSPPAIALGGQVAGGPRRRA